MIFSSHYPFTPFTHFTPPMNESLDYVQSTCTLQYSIKGKHQNPSNQYSSLITPRQGLQIEKLVLPLIFLGTMLILSRVRIIVFNSTVNKLRYSVKYGIPSNQNFAGIVFRRNNGATGMMKRVNQHGCRVHLLISTINHCHLELNSGFPRRWLETS